MRAVVAGAGIGGLAAALALAQRGWRVEVIEAAGALAEVGAGLQMSPNAMRVLDALGVAARVEAEGFAPQAAELRHWRTGALHGAVALGDAARARWGAPYVHVHRADLHAALMEAARTAGVVVTVATRVTGYAEGGARVDTTDGGRDADLLVGADGIRSAVRAAMLGDAPPRFTGQVAWRAVVPADRLPGGRDGGLVPPVAAVFCGPGRHAVLYRLRGGALVNLVAVEERRAWAEEDWRQPGDPQDLVRAFDGWAAPVAGVIAMVRECHLWGLFDRAPLPRWVDGRVVLLGDAAHPMLPFLAQGAAQAIEDAAALARHVAQGATPAALAAYQAERRPRTAAIQAASRANAALYHRHGAAALKLAVLRMAPGLMRARLDPVYEHDAVRGT